MRPSKPLAVTWSLEHGGAVTVPRPRGPAICFARRPRKLLRAVAADITVVGRNRYRESVDGEVGRYGGG